MLSMHIFHSIYIFNIKDSTAGRYVPWFINSAAVKLRQSVMVRPTQTRQTDKTRQDSLTSHS